MAAPSGSATNALRPDSRAPRFRLARVGQGPWALLNGLLALVGLAALSIMVTELWPRNSLSYRSLLLHPRPVPVDAGPPGKVTGVRVDEAIWTVQDPSPAQRVAASLPTVLGCLLVLTAVVLALLLVRRLRADLAFTPATLRLWTALSLVVTVGSPAVAIALMVCRWVLGTISGHGGIVYLDPRPAAPMIVGVFMLALANVFRRGIGLADDVDGLV